MAKQICLMDEVAIAFYPSLAKLVGVNAAIVIQQIHFLWSLPRGGSEHEGHKWVYNTYQDWQRDHFPFWSINTIIREFNKLEEMGYLLSCQPEGKNSRRKHYRLNRGIVQNLTFEAASELNIEDDHLPKMGSSASTQNGYMDLPKLGSSLDTDTTYSDTTTEEDLRSDSATVKKLGTPLPKASVAATHFVGWFLSTLPNGFKAKNINKWQLCYDSLIEEGRTDEEIRAACAWARKDEFWSKNFLSPIKLTTQKDGVTYLDRFLAQIKPVVSQYNSPL